MRTTLDIPATLLSEAKKTLKVKTKTQAIVIALNEVIQRHRSQKILSLQGSLKSRYNHKELRRKR